MTLGAEPLLAASLAFHEILVLGEKTVTDGHMTHPRVLTV